MDNFRPESDGTLLTLDREESVALRRLIGEMRQILSGDDRSDPALERLYPRAFEAEEDERNYRDLVASDLQQEKIRSLEAMADSLGEGGKVSTVLDADQVTHWLTGLTDLRLTLGVRLGVTEDLTGDDIDPDDPDAYAWALLHWLGWLQEQLLAAIDPGYRRNHDGAD
jgi:hypothetical protein